MVLYCEDLGLPCASFVCKQLKEEFMQNCNHGMVVPGEVTLKHFQVIFHEIGCVAAYMPRWQRVCGHIPDEEATLV